MKLTAVAAVLTALGVAAGAFGTHALRSRLAPDLLRVWETGVQYHQIHAVAATLISLLTTKWAPRVALLLLVGVTIFSGSLYVLALTNTRWLGAVTPLGGLFLIGGWLYLAAAAVRA